jgi:hypothetical protein
VRERAVGAGVAAVGVCEAEVQREGVSSSGSRRTELVQLPCKGEGRGAGVAAAGLREGRCRAREMAAGGAALLRVLLRRQRRVDLKRSHVKKNPPSVQTLGNEEKGS